MPEEEERDNIYNKEEREQLVEDGEISAEEEGFINGYEDADEYDKEN